MPALSLSLLFFLSDKILFLPIPFGTDSYMRKRFSDITDLSSLIFSDTAMYSILFIRNISIPGHLPHHLHTWPYQIAVLCKSGEPRGRFLDPLILTFKGMTSLTARSISPKNIRFQVVELGDTLFIVLRKKPLIFLHYYHHSAVLIYTLHSTAEHSNPGRTFVFMNYLAHSCMYTYYALVTYGFRLPKWVRLVKTAG
ncbi:GNS1/SUR4 family protein [Oesophagostomum dentatum]|uniref:Elongation of very long chain fatty acids protein n=1 Tax=Oesophagostomum dentatum TaxID=61180 RepID=A0A0B1RYZ6_OESDE|nr:GNS1/SUR4 family protein [Oesophagostomum dentatum]